MVIFKKGIVTCDDEHLFSLNIKLTEMHLDKARLIVPRNITSLFIVFPCH